MPDPIPLHDGWTLRPVGGVPATPLGPEVAIPATVPGCVHTDLLAAGLIADPYLDDNENRLQWIGRAAWLYQTRFDAPTGLPERIDLVCDGLDTIATITLNGAPIGHTRNMHRGYRFDVTGAVRPGGNELALRFDCVYDEAQRLIDGLGPRPAMYPEPFNFVRKMACNFGWDWGPTLVTAGIWRPIRLHAWSTARLAQVRPLVTVDGATGRVELHVDLERTPAGAGVPLTVALRVAGVETRASVAAGDCAAVLALVVPDPELWWPRGYGRQPLYDCEVTLHRADRPPPDPAGGPPLDRWHRRIGFRSVTLDTAGDEQRSAFAFVVNGVRTFARGVNWIPDDCFPTRVTRERYLERLRQAADMNVDLIRVWGGGLYETDEFYELCDQLGLMVWQDFLFACAAYPEEEPLRGEVEAEARHNVTRLACHPSLVLWNGNNENLWGFDIWHWREPLAGRSWGPYYYHDLLPRVVADLDPTRPYWPGSPWSGRSDRDPNDPRHGCAHIWDVWNEVDYLAYRSSSPPFVSEFGWQAPAAHATLRRALSDPVLEVDSPTLQHHQKAVYGRRNLDRGLAWHLPGWTNFDDWHYLAQLNQARAVAVGVEHWRASWPHTAGAVVWQLNDCWPALSWSCVDSAGRRKPVWYALRRAFADRMATVEPRDGVLTTVLVNQGPLPWRTRLTQRLVDARRGDLRAVDAPVTVAPRGVLAVPVPSSLHPEDPERQFFVADTDGCRATWFFVEDKDFAWPPTEQDVTVTATAEGWRVTVTAATVLRDLVLQADRIAADAQVDEALVTLCPGETTTFLVRTGHAGRTGSAGPAGPGEPGTAEVDAAAWRDALFSVGDVAQRRPA